jgi:hypothetical protein
MRSQAVKESRPEAFRHLSALWATAVAILCGPSLLTSDVAAQVRPASAVVPELVALVEQHGWLANMGRVCAVMKFEAADGCVFKQISISTSEPGTVDNHGFNIRTNAGTTETEILIFHLGPLIANFFVVSRNGELKASYYRAKGVDTRKFSKKKPASAFAASIAFWALNLPHLKKGFAKPKL